jgi:hypothetical protein
MVQSNDEDIYSLQHLRNVFEHIDKDIEQRGFHWKKILAAGNEMTNPLCVSIGLREGQEPSKEQILILDYYIRQGYRALCKFHMNGSLPNEIEKFLQKQ